MADRFWSHYVPMAERRAVGYASIYKELREGEALAPVTIQGKRLATTFWGKAWCDHFEQYSDFRNRLPRGRTYARNGSIVHLRMESGRVTAFVSGSNLYEVNLQIRVLPNRKWKEICATCSTSVHDALDLMRGQLPPSVLQTLTDPVNGIFPKDSDLRMSCTCPDWAHMCKHLAAAIYGIGSRLDRAPELLFLLRGVDQEDLIGATFTKEIHRSAINEGEANGLAEQDLSEIFGIELNADDESLGNSVKGRSPLGRKKRTKKRSKKASDEIAATEKTSARRKRIAKSKAVTKTKPIQESISKKRAKKPSVLAEPMQASPGSPGKRPLKKKK